LQAEVPGLGIHRNDVGELGLIGTERYPRHLFRKCQREWIAARETLPRVVETSGRRVDGKPGSPGRIINDLAFDVLQREVLIAQTVGGAKRGASISLHIPRQSKVRRELEPLRVEKIPMRLIRAGAIVL